MIVPNVRPFCHAHSSIPITRGSRTARAVASRFRWRRIVSSLVGMPRRASSLSLGRPPAARPNSRMISAARWVRCADGTASTPAPAAKMRRSHCSFRHRQRPTSSFTVAGSPWDRKVPQAYVRTVSSPRYRAAPRADRFADGDRLDHSSAIVTLGAKNVYVGAKRPHLLAFHQSPCQLHPDMVRWTMTCTELEEDPNKVQCRELGILPNPRLWARSRCRFSYSAIPERDTQSTCAARPPPSRLRSSGSGKRSIRRSSTVSSMQRNSGLTIRPPAASAPDSATRHPGCVSCLRQRRVGFGRCSAPDSPGMPADIRVRLTGWPGRCLRTPCR